MASVQAVAAAACGPPRRCGHRRRFRRWRRGRRRGRRAGHRGARDSGHRVGRGDGGRCGEGRRCPRRRRIGPWSGCRRCLRRRQLGRGPDAGAGVTFVTPSGLPGSAAAGLPGIPVAGPLRGSALDLLLGPCLLLGGFTLDARLASLGVAFSRFLVRLLALRLLSAGSLTMAPICGSCPRVRRRPRCPARIAGHWLTATRCLPGSGGRARTQLGAAGRRATAAEPAAAGQSAKLDTPSKPSQLLPSYPALYALPPYPCSNPAVDPV